MWDNWRIKKNRVARGFSRKDATKKNPNQITMPVNRSQQGKRKSTRRFREWIDTLFDQSDISCLFPSPSHTALLYVYDCSSDSGEKNRKEIRKRRREKIKIKKKKKKEMKKVGCVMRSHKYKDDGKRVVASKPNSCKDSRKAWNILQSSETIVRVLWRHRNLGFRVVCCWEK